MLDERLNVGDDVVVTYGAGGEKQAHIVKVYPGAVRVWGRIWEGERYGMIVEIPRQAIVRRALPVC